MIQQHNRFAARVLHWVENVGLIVILLATLVASFQELQVMVAARKVTLTDLPLLFLYLEIFTMLACTTSRASCRYATRYMLPSSRWRVTSCWA